MTMWEKNEGEGLNIGWQWCWECARVLGEGITSEAVWVVRGVGLVRRRIG